MAQVIKHRRGLISNVKGITTRNGEIIIASGSVSDLVGPFVFIGSPNTIDEGISGAYKTISKIYTGTNAPSIASSTYGSILDGTPFYASSDKSLYVLGNDGAGGNTRLDLAGNLEGRTISNLTVTALTGSTAVFNSITGSFTGSLTGIASNAVSASYAATASFANDFVVAGTLTAQTIIAQTITSSIEFITGSTRNGSLLTNTHQFTGSVLITGSLAINGVDYASTSASFETRILNNSASIDLLSGSYLASSASFDARILNNSGSIAQLSGSFLSVSGSNSTRITALELFSSSLDATYATDSELNAATASLSGSIAALSGSYLASSASFDTRILNNSSSVALLSGSYLASSASFDTRILNNSSSIASVSSSLVSFKLSYNTGSFTGSFIGDGAGLYNIPASGVVGLELNRIASGSATASISPVDGFRVNTNTEITGSAKVTGSLSVIGTVASSTLNTNGLLFGNGSNIITSMTAPSVDGQFPQWSGSAWIISNVVDGGFF